MPQKMNINQDKILQIANLAHLDLENDEAEAMIHDLNKILDWMGLLREVDTENIAPLTHPALEMNQFRVDQIQETLTREKALELAPKKNEAYFKVPKVKELKDE